MPASVELYFRESITTRYRWDKTEPVAASSWVSRLYPPGRLGLLTIDAIVRSADSRVCRIPEGGV